MMGKKSFLKKITLHNAEKLDTQQYHKEKME